MPPSRSGPAARSHRALEPAPTGAAGRRAPRQAARAQRPLGNQAAIRQALAGQPPARVGRARGSASRLPGRLQAGIEALSGVAMDGVRVHRDSAKPAEVGALAYTQGRDIHVAPGQERHLAHEAWHVVQQSQGRVRATMQMQGVAINDDPGLEREADRMGALALRTPAADAGPQPGPAAASAPAAQRAAGGQVAQRVPTKIPLSSKEDLFVVKKADLGHGTGTNETTRAHVNDAAVSKQRRDPVSIRYEAMATKPKNPTKPAGPSVKVPNPEPTLSYGSGRKYDAGHKLGRQNGGLGDVKDWVFPQHPAINQGNSKLQTGSEKAAIGRTHPLWRAHEDAFHQMVHKAGHGLWWIKWA